MRSFWIWALLASAVWALLWKSNAYAGGCVSTTNCNVVQTVPVVNKVQTVQTVAVTPLLVDANRQLLVTDFVVPVGVPVAEFAPTFYGLAGTGGLSGLAGSSIYAQSVAAQQYGALNRAEYQRQLNLNRRLSDPRLAEAIEAAAQVFARQDADAAEVHFQAPPDAPTTAAEVVQRSCVKCHSGESPKGGLDLNTRLSVLDADVRQSIIARVLSPDPKKRMPPKSKPLGVSEQQMLFRALVE